MYSNADARTTAERSVEGEHLTSQH